MKRYFTFIKYLQQILLFISIMIMVIFPLILVFNPASISDVMTLKIYLVAHITLFFVMMIRPLADIFTKTKWIRPLVILRKGAGVFSASIIVSFIISKLMIDPSGYLNSIGTIKYWSLVNYALLAHLADISAIILIVTSNNLSKRILGTWWKKIQRLSYVYFCASVLYVFLTYGNIDLLFMLLIVTLVTYLASVKNNEKLLESYKPASVPVSIRDTLPIRNKIRSI